jgi:hypothetical protein
MRGETEAPGEGNNNNRECRGVGGIAGAQAGRSVVRSYQGCVKWEGSVETSELVHPSFGGGSSNVNKKRYSTGDFASLPTPKADFWRDGRVWSTSRFGDGGLRVERAEESCLRPGWR